MMATNEHKYLSDFARKYYGEGEAKGKAEGLAAGEAKGRAEALLAVLTARGLGVSPAERHTILECTDSARLDRWIAHAVTVESVDALLTVT
jgi:flagellar biosynthesis/type III secretory pathway protein FliH